MASSSLNILTIGGSGFVSGAVTRKAVQSGHKVWAVTRGTRPLPEGVVGITVDRSDRAGFQAAIDQVDVHWDLVVDCIGYELDDARQDLSVFPGKARHFVFISTDFVYDPARRNFPQSDDNPYFLSEGYGGKKRLCELEFLNADTDDMTCTIFRPCHIYGPGSLLGCLPAHGRDPELIDRMRAGEPLKLVGGGHFLQQPIFVRDLAELILSSHGNENARGQIYLSAGPDIIESREYYRIIAETLGIELNIEELPVGPYVAEHPEHASFLCHRIYDLTKMREHRLKAPATPIVDGLREHVASLTA